jgi:hypothetical protein
MVHHNSWQASLSKMTTASRQASGMECQGTTLLKSGLKFEDEIHGGTHLLPSHPTFLGTLYVPS